MVRYLPMLFAVALLLYSFIDCASADARRVRNLPKAAWFLVILMPIVGPLAWLFAGRPPRESQSWPLRPGSRPEQPRTLAPDDDPAFLEALRRRKADEDLLKKWEDDLRRREQQLRGDESEDAG
ncbi:PLD nuclease N-terminal domain-containing protein [Propioniciclava tarda]|uniref:PLDc_N domain-containing protein n=1 Tax=Propioniciclava tarda TaxID=433330 RepID=A0A4Q9KNY9_PROTD|nr:PLD nuclease N-terminal domain-containing protein [Propioniciclava tarda]TBT95539.1 PLDc_N domain-containing protein [Propioniciclava tarda]SMO50681.1 Phospholipase_D-nuclease N-terminal [Propioniciclava tarda]